MRKAILFLFMAALLAVVASPAFAAQAGQKYHVGIITSTVSQSEDSARGAEFILKKYGDVSKGGKVKYVTYPDNFSAEMETTISQIASMADDPLMKVVVVCEAIPGTTEAFRRIKEKRPDIIFVTAPIWDDPVLMAKNIDLCLDTDWVRRGETIARKAQKMGAKTLVHYSVPAPSLWPGSA